MKVGSKKNLHATLGEGYLTTGILQNRLNRLRGGGRGRENLAGTEQDLKRYRPRVDDADSHVRRRGGCHIFSTCKVVLNYISFSVGGRE